VRHYQKIHTNIQGTHEVIKGNKISFQFNNEANNVYSDIFNHEKIVIKIKSDTIEFNKVDDKRDLRYKVLRRWSKTNSFHKT